MIEMKNEDSIYKDIEFLDYDLNYKRGYFNYKNSVVFTIQHPKGESEECASGKIIDVNEFEFVHDIKIEKDSSGCPIILYTKQVNLIQVIGIHKNSHHGKDLNCGIFIGEIFNNENSDIKINLNDNNNYIIAEIVITDKDINKEVRIINSYEEFRRCWKKA